MEVCESMKHISTLDRFIFLFWWIIIMFTLLQVLSDVRRIADAVEVLAGKELQIEESTQAP